MEIILAQEHHLPQVLDIQARHHVSVLADKPETGFLTYRCDLPTLAKIRLELGIIVCIVDDVVVGYDMLMTYERAVSEQLYAPMLNEYMALKPQTDTSKLAVSAQYCVERQFRGGTVVRAIFRKESELLKAAGYTASVGEVDQKNRSSLLTVTKMLGYKFVGEYKAADGTSWDIVDKDHAK